MIDLAARTVTCPAGRVARFRRMASGNVRPAFGQACAACPLVVPLHDLARGSDDRGRPARGAPRRRPCRYSRSGLAGRLPGDPADRRAQARPPHAPTTRRQTGPRPGPAQGRRRLRPPRRSREPGAARQARGHLAGGPGRSEPPDDGRLGPSSHATGPRSRAPPPASPDDQPRSAVRSRASPSAGQNARFTPAT